MILALPVGAPPRPLEAAIALWREGNLDCVTSRSSD